MILHGLKIALVVYQTFWMLVVLPGHVRGMIVLGPDVPPAAVAKHACCAEEDAPVDPAKPISQDRKDRCAVCYQAAGYTLPPVYDIDLAPTGFCELCRLIEPTKRHQLLCSPTYFANGPPAVAASA